ncbi:hypothetical protein Tco_1267496, partial [Tanacetum coccineum]
FSSGTSFHRISEEATSLEMLGAPASGKGYTTTQANGHIKIADFDSRITVVPNAASGRGIGTKITAERGEDVQSGEHKSQVSLSTNIKLSITGIEWVPTKHVQVPIPEKVD